MIHLENDYSSAALPEIFDALRKSNFEGNAGYGLDSHTLRASSLILDKCGGANRHVFFLTGGTQTNAVALDWLCRPGEGVLSTQHAHINVHESGAIESCGIKVIALSSEDGKLCAKDIDSYMCDYYEDSTWPHIVRPSAVYISQPTELGTLYTLDELTAIRCVCDKYNLALYLDGARLLYALASPSNNAVLSDIANLTDMFYIGGTKAGTLFGEALVIPNQIDVHRFFSHIKRHGALMAKGWLTAVQYERMFEDTLYQTVGKHAIEIAELLRYELISIGYREVIASVTNQLFFELDDDSIQKLSGHVSVDVQKRLSDNTHLVRFVTDWSNTKEDVKAVIQLLQTR